MFLPRGCWNPFSNEQSAERQHSRSVVRTVPRGFWEWLTHCRRFKHPSLLASSKPFEWHVLNCCPSRCLPSDLGLISGCPCFVVSRFEPQEQCNKWLQLQSSEGPWSYWRDHVIVIAGLAAWTAGWEFYSQLSLLQKTERKGHFDLFIFAIIQIFEQLVFKSQKVVKNFSSCISGVLLELIQLVG